jgi:hypothetical protein
MEALLGFQVGFWDYATFAALFVIVAAGLITAVFILGLPGRPCVIPSADVKYQQRF